MAVLDIIKRNLIQVRQDLDPEWMSADTRMRAELDLTSIDLLNLLALMTQSLGRKLMYESLLLPGGKPRQELTLGELAAFIEANLDAAPPAVKAM